MSGKYLRIKKNEKSHDNIFLFEMEIGHNDMLGILKKTYPDVEVISAGFWSVNGNGSFHVYGRSVSLNIDSHESDSMLFNLRFDL